MHVGLRCHVAQLEPVEGAAALGTAYQAEDPLGEWGLLVDEGAQPPEGEGGEVGRLVGHVDVDGDDRVHCALSGCAAPRGRRVWRGRGPQR